MTIKHMDEYRDPAFAQSLVEQIRKKSNQKIRLMEVCGTHTVSIFRSGIRDLLSDTIDLISGPGCPVCVTAQNEIDAFIALAQKENVIIATFGDLMRVPGTDTSLQKQKAEGADIRIVYSTFDAVNIARQHPDKAVAFLGVGFETTAPTIAASIVSAKQTGVDNYFVFSAHKLVPPALSALLNIPDVGIDGFILPGHVSVIIGLESYRPFFDKFQTPCVVAGFEPTDILQGVSMLVDQIQSGNPQLENAYPRAVTEQGNKKARAILEEVFDISDANWRGVGVIPNSGLKINKAHENLDAQIRFDVTLEPAPEPKGCACGEILTGKKIPPDCALYKTKCNPMDPVGPCMVSSEGTCAAYYRFHAE